MHIDEKYLSGHNQITAEIIADSINPHGSRLTTFVLQLPRIVLAEFNTHRAIGRNSASSRAIPFKKMLEKVKNSPFIPIAFQKDHSGMQGTHYLEGVDLVDAVEAWQDAATEATLEADNLSRIGVTKQLCNRLLEPFLYHTVIATASNWQNFFALRAHEAAEIHIADLAHKMLNVYNYSQPKKLEFGEWHIPFGDKMPEASDEQKRMIAVSRAARVSYDNFDGPSSLEKDLALYKKLSEMGHWSPFEHVAEAAWIPCVGQGGNLDDSWLQLRKTFQNENKTDSRIITK